MQAARFNFCPQCGKPLGKSLIGDQLRLNCPYCSFVHWGEFSLGVGGIIWQENKVLLVERANNPGKGLWTIPGGYVDQGEQIADAVKREIREETGLITEPQTLIALWDWPGDKHMLYVVFLMHRISGTLQADPAEVSKLGFFTIEECREINITALSLSLIKDSYANQAGLKRTNKIEVIGDITTLYQVSGKSWPETAK
jgi:ADP-ribose pyrophosphatase YjhB (NUDIX family)